MNRLLSALVVVVLAGGSPAAAADQAAIRAAIAKGVAYLADEGQAADGSFSAEVGPAVTALAVTALARSGRPVDDPAVTRGLDYLLSFRRPGGGIHAPDSPVANYETSIALLALAACNAGGRHDRVIAEAEAFVRGLQWDGGEGKSVDDPAYGGAGYGKKSRPDLSNTQFLIEALRTVGASAEKNPDGGFYYTPAAGGESQAGQTPDGGLRSYGSMTYAGLKSMIFAGLGREDPRVAAAIAWLRKHYTFAENPGMGQAGLYYYFHTAAKALDALGEDRFADAEGTGHDWRGELSDVLLAKQRANGSWSNDNKRWMEDDPNLVTSYVLLALAYCLPR
jgi:squalene-hopene/tetraprenyl-beta-curcumene cyclase